nr:MAG TPA: terminase large subunit [Caudoviricetes sp.]
MKVTSVFVRNLDAYRNGYRYVVNKGSTRSSKTYSVLQLLYLIAELSAKPRIISIVSETMPHLKKGCIRDFKEILQNENKWNENNWNETNSIYKVNNSTIEFFSVDNPSKVHGPARDILYVNECINIEYEIYRQLAIRTRETIFLDCNPCFAFWLDEKVLIQTTEALLIHSTYKDNEYLTEAQIKEIESNKNDANWWKVYGLGLTGSLVGAIMQNWDIVKQMPENYKKRWIGIDFGYTNDPTAIIDIRLAGGELWINELLYAKGYDNLMIAEHLEICGLPKGIEIVADSAEPKSIAEIRSKGWRVEPAKKGKDSVNTGISILNRYVKHITENSTSVINEYRNYRWQINEFGDPTNVPTDKFNHSIDAQRYVCLNKLLENNNSFSYTVINR